ncbi:hypothetical protein FRB99_003812, partial [Tulasnella sp. 403]
ELGRLSSVCTFWAATINQAPKLWTLVCDHYDPRLVDKIINKSGNCSLSLLSKIWHYTDSQGADGTTESLLKQLHPTIHRWKDAELFMCNENERYLEACIGDESAPRLKKLRVFIDDGNGAPINMFLGGAGHLEELDLTSLPIHWTSPLLSRLQILRLSYLIEEAAELTINHLLTTLMQCPTLSELEVDNCYFNETTISDHLPARLQLPHLRVLNLCEITPPLVPYLVLSRLSSPKYDRFRLVSGDVEETHLGDVMQSLSHHIPSFGHLVSSARKVVIILGDIRCRYLTRSTRNEIVFHLFIEDYSSMAVLRWITEAIASIPEGVDAKLVLGRYMYTASEEEVATICSRIPTITILRVESNQSPLIRYLSAPGPALIDGTKHWPFPKLTSLFIEEDACDPHELLTMVARRYGRDTKSESTVELPQRLSSLIINRRWETSRPSHPTIRQVCQIVGADVFENKSLKFDKDPFLIHPV